MLDAFFFVTTRTFKNRIVSRLRRLREPRYLVSFLAGLGYLYFMVLRNARHGRPFPIGGTDLFIDFAAVFFLVGAIVAWALPGASGGLEFSEAEIQFLFAAPVTRRQLLVYKLMRGLPQLLISTAVMAWFLRRGNFVGIFTGFGAITVYLTMVRLGRARLRLAGIGFVARLAGVVAVLALLSWLFTIEVGHAKVGAALQNAFRSRRRTGVTTPATATATAVKAIDSPFHGPVPDAVLFLPRFFARAVFARTPAELAVNAAGVLGLAALFFFAASRLNVSFEEASVAVSTRRAERRKRFLTRRAGVHVSFPRIPPPFRLRENAPPEMAIFWKNLVAASRISIGWAAVVIVLFALVFIQAFVTHEDVLRAGLAMMALFMAGIFPFLGTALFPQDLRLDLPRMEVLKSYPLDGVRLIAAELAAPLAIVSAVELILLGGSSIIMQLVQKPRGPLAILARPEVVVTALLFAVPLCAAQLLIRNAVPVFLPAWGMRSKDEPRGFVQVGQRLVVLVGNILVLSVALIPAAILFVPALLIASRFFGGSPAVLAVATVPAVGLLLGEVWLGVRLLGAQFDRIDVTNDLDPVG